MSLTLLLVAAVAACCMPILVLSGPTPTPGDEYEGGIGYVPPGVAVIAYQWGSLNGEVPRLVRESDSFWSGARYKMQAVASQPITGEILQEAYFSFQGTTYNGTGITFVGGFASLPFAYYTNNTLLTDPTPVPSFYGQPLNLPSVMWPHIAAIPILTPSIFSLQAASSSMPAPIPLIAGAVLPNGPLTLSLRATEAATGTVVMSCSPVVTDQGVSLSSGSPFGLTFVLQNALQQDVPVSQGIPPGSWECFLTSTDLTSDIVVLPARLPFVVQTSGPLLLQLLDADSVPVKHLDTLLIGPSYALKLQSNLPVVGSILMTCSLSGSYKFTFPASPSASALSSTASIASSSVGQDTCVFSPDSDLTNQLLTFADWAGNSMNLNFGSVNSGVSAGVLNDVSHSTSLLFQTTDRTQDIPSGGPWTLSMIAPTTTTMAWSITINCMGTVNADVTSVSLSFASGSAGSVVASSPFSAALMPELYSCTLTGSSTPSTVHVTSTMMIYAKTPVTLTLSYDLGSGNTGTISSGDSQWVGASTPMVLTSSAPVGGTVQLLCTITTGGTTVTVASATFIFHQSSSISASLPILSQSAGATCALVPATDFLANAILTAATPSFTLATTFAALSFVDSVSAQSSSLELGTAAVGSGVSATVQMATATTTTITVGCVGTNGDLPNALITMSAATTASALISPALVAQSYDCSVSATAASGFAPRAIFSLRVGTVVPMTLTYNDAAATQAVVLVGGVRQWIRLRSATTSALIPSLQGAVSLICGLSVFIFTFDGTSTSSSPVEFIPPVGSTCHWSGSSISGVSVTFPLIPTPATLSFGSGFSGVNTLGAAVLNVSDPNLPQSLQIQMAAAILTTDSISLQFTCRSSVSFPPPSTHVDVLVAALSVLGGANTGTSSTGFTQIAGIPIAQVYQCQVSMNAVVGGVSANIDLLADFRAVTLPVVGLMPSNPCDLYDAANIGSSAERPITVSQPFPRGFSDGVASPRGGLTVALSVRGSMSASGTSLGAFTSLLSLGMGSTGLNRTGFYWWLSTMSKTTVFPINSPGSTIMTAKAAMSFSGSAYTGPIWSRVGAAYTDSFVVRVARDNSVTAPTAPGYKFTRVTTSAPPSSKFTSSQFRSQNGLMSTLTVSGVGVDNQYPTGPSTSQCLANPASGTISSVYWPVPVWDSPYGVDFIRRAQHTYLLPTTVVVYGKIVPGL